MGTIVDFQVNASEKIDISKALGGYSPVNLMFDEIEGTKAGEYTINIRDHSHGTGTRKSAIRLRTFVLNVVKENHVSKVC